LVSNQLEEGDAVHGLLEGSLRPIDKKLPSRSKGYLNVGGLFAGDLQSFRSVPRERYETVMQDAPAWQKDCSTTENMIQRAVYFEIKTFLNGLLVTEDHISMAHSLETRVPFLDNALGDLACRIPASRKIRIEGLLSEDCNGHIESVDGKTILRDAMRDFLPKEFTQQQKQGFSPPDANWYRGPSVDYIKSILLDAKTRQRPWFDQAHVGNCLEEHFQGQHNHRLLIWSLLSFEWLQRHFIDQPV
jgi:asparagine synthetase B (glutamine-hydrolysing)